VAGRTGQRLWSTVDAADRLDPANPTALTAEHTPVREYVVKLVRLKKTLHTAEARRIARGRHRFMVSFFNRLGREAAGEV
jgi:HD superfamily phosphodiesterase